MKKRVAYKVLNINGPRVNNLKMSTIKKSAGKVMKVEGLRPSKPSGTFFYP